VRVSLLHPGHDETLSSHWDEWTKRGNWDVRLPRVADDPAEGDDEEHEGDYPTGRRRTRPSAP
jgi:hypothetical protein